MCQSEICPKSVSRPRARIGNHVRILIFEPLLESLVLGLGTIQAFTIGFSKVEHIDDTLEILLVLALGRPSEEVELEYIESGENIKYWRDENGVHHVPKRPLAEIIVRKYD